MFWAMCDLVTCLFYVIVFVFTIGLSTINQHTTTDRLKESFSNANNVNKLYRVVPTKEKPIRQQNVVNVAPICFALLFPTINKQ